MNNFSRKRFGQHFLHDPTILDSLFKAIHPEPSDIFVEIGPGRGALTDYLLNQCEKLILIEIDRDLVNFLRSKYTQKKNITLFQQDALTFNFSEIKPNTTLLRIVGNLPYNISTPLLFHLFAQINCIKDMHFMLQKEVVMRLTAAVGSTNYGRLSVMAQYFCKNISLFDVSANAFIPPPRVESAVVRLVPKKNLALTAEELNQFSTIVKEAFSYRRKMIGNALKKIIPAEKWSTIGINPQLRPQDLTVEDFINITLVRN